VNPANKDTLMTVNQLKQILLGQQKKWSALPGEIAVIYDQNNSANYNFLKAYCGNQEMGKNAFAVKSNEEVINYVKKNPNAVGVIGVNWISDQDDFDVVNFLNGIKVVGLSIKEGQEYYQPYAGYIYTKEYPLTREIWIINKGRRAGLNSGFVNFMVGDIGQTIIQKSSIVPARNPVRLIEFKEENM
jgi:phosphate transport system substrate-binding protein